MARGTNPRLSSTIMRYQKLNFMAGGFLSKLHCTEVNSIFFVCGPIVKNSNLYNEKIVCFFCHFFAHLLVNYVRVVWMTMMEIFSSTKGCKTSQSADKSKRFMPFFTLSKHRPDWTLCCPDPGPQPYFWHHYFKLTNVVTLLLSSPLGTFPPTSMWLSGSELTTLRHSSVRKPFSTLKEPR